MNNTFTTYNNTSDIPNFIPLNVNQPDALLHKATTHPLSASEQDQLARQAMQHITPSFSQYVSAVTGGDRNTTLTENSPRAIDTSVTQGQPSQFKMPDGKPINIETMSNRLRRVVGLLASSSVKGKIAIMRKEDPNLKVFTDNKNNTFIIPSQGPQVGKPVILDRPGFSKLDAYSLAGFLIPAGAFANVARFLGLGAAAASAASFAGADAAVQSTGQALGNKQSFNKTEVGINAGLGLITPAAGHVIKSIFTRSEGDAAAKIAQKYLERTNLQNAADKAGAPLFTSDVFPPKTIIGKGINKLSKINQSIPLTGTKDIKIEQVDKINQAINELATKPQSIENQTKLLDLNNQLAKINEDIGKAKVENPPTITNPELDIKSRNDLIGVLKKQKVPQDVIDKASQEVGVSLKNATFNEARQIVIKVRNKLSKISIGTNDSPKIKADINSTRSTISELDKELNNITTRHDVTPFKPDPKEKSLLAPLPGVIKNINYTKPQEDLINLSNDISSPGRTATGQPGVTAKVHLNEVDAQKLANVFLNKVDSSKIPGDVKTVFTDATQNKLILKDLAPIVDQLPKDTISAMRESVLQTHASRILANGGKMTGKKLLSILDTPAKLLFDENATNRLKGFASLVNLLKEPKEPSVMMNIVKKIMQHKITSLTLGAGGAYAIGILPSLVPAVITSLIGGGLSLIGKGFESRIFTDLLMKLTKPISKIAKKQVTGRLINIIVAKGFNQDVIKELKSNVDSIINKGSTPKVKASVNTPMVETQKTINQHISGLYTMLKKPGISIEKRNGILKAIKTLKKQRPKYNSIDNTNTIIPNITKQKLLAPPKVKASGNDSIFKMQKTINQHISGLYTMLKKPGISIEERNGILKAIKTLKGKHNIYDTSPNNGVIAGKAPLQQSLLPNNKNFSDIVFQARQDVATNKARILNESKAANNKAIFNLKQDLKKAKTPQERDRILKLIDNFRNPKPLRNRYIPKVNNGPLITPARPPQKLLSPPRAKPPLTKTEITRSFGDQVKAEIKKLQILRAKSTDKNEILKIDKLLSAFKGKTQHTPLEAGILLSNPIKARFLDYVDNGASGFHDTGSKIQVSVKNELDKLDAEGKINSNNSNTEAIIRKVIVDVVNSTKGVSSSFKKFIVENFDRNYKRDVGILIPSEPKTDYNINDNIDNVVKELKGHLTTTTDPTKIADINRVIDTLQGKSTDKPSSDTTATIINFKKPSSDTTAPIKYKKPLYDLPAKGLLDEFRSNHILTTMSNDIIFTIKTKDMTGPEINKIRIDKRNANTNIIKNNKQIISLLNQFNVLKPFIKTYIKKYKLTPSSETLDSILEQIKIFNDTVTSITGRPVDTLHTKNENILSHIKRLQKTNNNIISNIEKSQNEILKNKNLTLDLTNEKTLREIANRIITQIKNKSAKGLRTHYTLFGTTSAHDGFTIDILKQLIKESKGK